MKKVIIAALLFSASVSNAMSQEKDSYFLALSTMSNDLSVFTFMIDQHLEKKCGKDQSIDSLKQGSESYLQIAISLKEGNYQKAQNILEAIPCVE